MTAALFALGKWALGLYLGKKAVGSAFGAAGSLVAILVWVYYAAQILFFGAELTQVFARRHGSRAFDGERATAGGGREPARTPPPRGAVAARAPGAAPGRPSAVPAALTFAIALLAWLWPGARKS
jgi:hypothetical protein